MNGVRALALVALGFLAISATGGAVFLMAHPLGSPAQMPLSVLEHSPVSLFPYPGNHSAGFQRTAGNGRVRSHLVPGSPLRLVDRSARRGSIWLDCGGGDHAARRGLAPLSLLGNGRAPHGVRMDAPRPGEPDTNRARPTKRVTGEYISANFVILDFVTARLPALSAILPHP